MALDYLLRNGVQTQIDIIQSVANALINPPAVNIVGQVASLLNVLGVVSRKQVITHSKKVVVISRTPNTPPIEAVKGIGKKLGVKLRAVGINTIGDLINLNSKTFNIPGISQTRIQKWQASL